MSCSKLTNLLSGVALICGPVGADLPSRSYRVQQSHHRSLIGTITVGPANDGHRPAIGSFRQANGRFRRDLDLRHGIREGRQPIAAAVIPRTRGGPSVMGQPEKSRNRRNTASQPPTAETLTHMGDQHFNDVVRVKARLPTQGVLRAQLFRRTSPIHRMSRTPNSSPPRGQCGPARRD